MEFDEVVETVFGLIVILLFVGFPVFIIWTSIENWGYDEAVSKCLVKGYADAIKHNGTWVCTKYRDPRHEDTVPVFIPVMTGK